MSKIIRSLLNLRVDKRGVTALEYGLIAALIGGAIVAGVSLLGTNIGATFNNIANTVVKPAATK